MRRQNLSSLFHLMALAGCLVSLPVAPRAQPNKASNEMYTESMMQDSCRYLSMGRNAYFILEPGYRLILQGIEGKDTAKLVITVLDETKKIGGVETRVVEENESVNGRPVEISRNFYAYCPQNGSIYYFGEEVDIFRNGKPVKHEGAWKAEGNNKAGLAMPGLPLLGARYYQEMAPGIAMDRAEIISISLKMNTAAGLFTHVLKTEETSPLEPGHREYKYYAAGVGLIKDENLVLTKYGFLQ